VCHSHTLETATSSFCTVTNFCVQPSACVAVGVNDDSDIHIYEPSKLYRGIKRPWLAAMDKEIQAQHEFQTWEVVSLPVRKLSIGCGSIRNNSWPMVRKVQSFSGY
jgi:hypothetical protein